MVLLDSYPKFSTLITIITSINSNLECSRHSSNHFTRIINSTTLCNRYFYHNNVHFIHMKTDTQRVKQLAKSHTASNGQITIFYISPWGYTSILLTNSLFPVAQMVALTKCLPCSSDGPCN